MFLLPHVEILTNMWRESHVNVIHVNNFIYLKNITSTRPVHMLKLEFRCENCDFHMKQLPEDISINTMTSQNLDLFIISE